MDSNGLFSLYLTEIGMLSVKRQTQQTAGPTQSTYETTESDEREGECHICWRPTKRRCGMCNKDFYCSESCQEKRSGSHLFMCSKRPLTSANYLWESLREVQLPEEDDVLQDFGFNNATSVTDKYHLLGLYIGLYLSGKFSAEIIHDWRVKGILVEKIKEFYYGIPEGSRGEYFPWFLKNSYALERSITTDESQQITAATFYDEAKLYLDIEDRDKRPMNLKPECKGIAYGLLAQILLRFSPDPTQKDYYSLGFVTCRGHYEESTLVNLYLLLVTESDESRFYDFYNSRRGEEAARSVTFEQFWKAFEAGKLIELMDSKGLKNLRSGLLFLEGFLSVPPTGPHPSVWSLKQFLKINDLEKRPPAPSVLCDYGFGNCRTREETWLLMETYKKTSETANPLALHQACVKGQLFSFVSLFVRMQEEWRPLMWNPYPLKDIEEPEPALELQPGPVGPEPGPEREFDDGSETLLPGPELRSELPSTTNEGSTSWSSLWSKFWGFIGGVDLLH